MRATPARVVLGVTGLAVGVVAVLAMREATLSTHQPVAPGSKTEVVITASTKGGEANQSLDEMVEALLLTCRLEVASDLVTPVTPVESLGDGRYRAVLSPSLDQTNRRQFRGCIEDWSIDHLRADVVSFAELA